MPLYRNVGLYINEIFERRKKSMADLNISEILGYIMSVADRNKNKHIENGEERSIFDQEVKKYNFDAQEEMNLYAEAGLELSASSRRKAPQKVNGVHIDVDASTTINITMNVDIDIQKLVDELTQNFDAKIGEVIAKMQEGNQSIIDIVTGMFNTYQGDYANLIMILSQISTYASNNNEVLNYMKDVLDAIYEKQLNFYQKVDGWDIEGLINKVNEIKDSTESYRNVEYNIQRNHSTWR